MVYSGSTTIANNIHCQEIALYTSKRDSCCSRVNGKCRGGKLAVDEGGQLPKNVRLLAEIDLETLRRLKGECGASGGFDRGGLNCGRRWTPVEMEACSRSLHLAS